MANGGLVRGVFTAVGEFDDLEVQGLDFLVESASMAEAWIDDSRTAQRKF